MQLLGNLASTLHTNICFLRYLEQIIFIKIFWKMRSYYSLRSDCDRNAVFSGRFPIVCCVPLTPHSYDKVRNPSPDPTVR
jgi:hypothetical protein